MSIQGEMMDEMYLSKLFDALSPCSCGAWVRLDDSGARFHSLQGGQCFCASDVVGAGDVDSQADAVINVDVVRPLWVDGDVDNQLQILPEGN